MRAILTLAVGLIPSSAGKLWLLRKLGHNVSPSAQIAPIVVLHSRLEVGAHARIGPFNVFRGLHLRVENGGEIGQWNWFSAAPFLVEASNDELAGTLHVGREASITSRHYFDASGGVDIGPFVTVAGVRSVFMTHGIDVMDNVLDTDRITVGAYAMVGGCTSLVMGSTVPPRSSVAMGSVVIRGLSEEGVLYAGSPAACKKPLDASARPIYWGRTTGKVPVRRRV